MAFTTRFPVRNSTAGDLRVVVEPWAHEFVLAGGEELVVVLQGPDRAPPLEIEWHPYGLIVWAGEGGSTCEVFKAGVLIA